MKYFYGIVCVFGAVAPMSVFISWVSDNGMNITLVIAEIASSKLSIFAWLDVVISALALLAFILVDSKRSNVKHSWLAIAGTLSVGVSFGFPLYLCLREHYKNTVAP